MQISERLRATTGFSRSGRDPVPINTFSPFGELLMSSCGKEAMKNRQVQTCACSTSSREHPMCLSYLCSQRDLYCVREAGVNNLRLISGHSVSGDCVDQKWLWVRVPWWKDAFSTALLIPVGAARWRETSMTIFNLAAEIRFLVVDNIPSSAAGPHPLAGKISK